jgi:hypothetical protein
MENFRDRSYVPRVAWSRPNPATVEHYRQQECPANSFDSVFSSLNQENPNIQHRTVSTTDPWDQYYHDDVENAEMISQHIEGNTEVLKKNREAQDMIDKIVQQYLPMESWNDSALSQPKNETSVTFQSFLGWNEGSPHIQSPISSRTNSAPKISQLSASSTAHPIGTGRPSMDTSFIANYFLNSALQRASEQIPVSRIDSGESSSSDPIGGDAFFPDACASKNAEQAADYSISSPLRCPPDKRLLAPAGPTLLAIVADKDGQDCDDDHEIIVGGVGVGLLFQFRDTAATATAGGRMCVDYVFPAGPAHGHVLAGDVVEAVDGVSVSAMTEAEFRQVPHQSRDLACPLVPIAPCALRKNWPYALVHYYFSPRIGRMRWCTIIFPHALCSFT